MASLDTLDLPNCEEPWSRGRLGRGGAALGQPSRVSCLRTTSHGVPGLRATHRLTGTHCGHLGLPVHCELGRVSFHEAQCQGPAEKRPQLLCTETLTAKGRGSWRDARNCLRGQRKGEAVELGGGERKEAVIGWQNARDSWGMKTGRRGGGREGSWGGSRNTEKTGSCYRQRPRKAGQTEWTRLRNVLFNLAAECQEKSSNTS